MFEDSVKEAVAADAASTHVLELARDYASDARSYLGKEDFYTAFSCISYAHGLLDALKEMTGKGRR
jgi:hypothetical protein